ncbi:uncharacterized protein LOC118435938 isoform X1 [Folsomia candida]|uniref:uncharacterized protein LOC118435938 isoform X1 n=1 Tax=Folsomia candida TaxID=158441 RepID=UPI0016053EF7|nr:uncharacterized protein LOC118435938 isoform X1 [Folsomia candida]
MQKMGLPRDKIKIDSFLLWFIPTFEFAPALIFKIMETIGRLNIGYPIHCVLSVVYGCLPYICYAIEDSKALLMLKCLQVGFLQVRSYLEENLKVHHQFPIEKIHNLLINLRLQTQNCGDYLATQQLFSILMTLYSTGVSFYAFVAVMSNESVGGGAEKTILLVFVSIWPLYARSRLYTKVYIAVKITKEEKRIADIIKFEKRKMKRGTFGSDEYSSEMCIIQLQEVYNLLTLEPTEVSFNDYVKLNNPLILGVFQQIFTLIIILMQFPK